MDTPALTQVGIAKDGQPVTDKEAVRRLFPDGVEEEDAELGLWLVVLTDELEERISGQGGFEIEIDGYEIVADTP